MKKIIRIAIAALFVSVFFTNRVIAQTEPTGQPEPQNVSLISEELEYILPFPGILPDNSLYFVKELRDTLMRMFISSPVKKIEFSLLQSDKYLAMALSFADTKKWDWAGKVTLQSQKEMEQAIAEVISARKSGVVVPRDLVVNMERSTVKHKQRIDEMKIQSHEKADGIFQKSSDAFAQLAAQASSLREE
jgi:hypothetical protein